MNSRNVLKILTLEAAKSQKSRNISYESKQVRYTNKYVVWLISILILGVLMNIHMSDSFSLSSQSNLNSSSSLGVSNNAPGSNIASSKPISQINGNLTVATAGDFGCDSNAKDSLTNIRSSNPDLLLVLGDLSYAPSPDCWFGETKSLDNKTKVVMGNHDEDEGSPPSLAAEYKKHYEIPKGYYSFNFNKVHFLMMDSETKFDIGSPQYSFVTKDLSNTSSDSSIKWIIVAFHTPMYTSPSNHPPNVSLRHTYHPLFDKYRVDLVLQAHNHNYQRSFPLTYNNGSSDNPIMKSKNTSVYLNPNGEIFMEAGTGGKSLYDFQGKAPFMVTQYKGYGFLDLALTENSNGRNLTGTFYPNKDGSIRDKFTILK